MMDIGDVIMLAIAAAFTLVLYGIHSQDKGNNRLEALSASATPKGALPLPVKTPEFEQRYAARAALERKILAIGLVIALILACSLVLLSDLSRAIGFTIFFLYCTPYLTRGIADMISRAREVKAGDPDALHIRARRIALLDHLPAWAIISIIGAFLGMNIPIFLIAQEHTYYTPYTIVSIAVAVLLTILGWFLTVRLAQQPIYATSEADLRWEDRLISEDILISVLYASILAPVVLLYAFVTERDPAIWMSGIFFAGIITIVIIAFLGTRQAQRRLWPAYSEPSYRTNSN